MERPLAYGRMDQPSFHESVPLERSRNWIAWVNRGLNDEQLEGIRTSVNRGRPFGSEAWVQKTARHLGLEFTLRGPGRPRTISNNQ
jgi:putative transposase